MKVQDPWSTVGQTENEMWVLPSEVLPLQSFGQKVLHFQWENQAVHHLLTGNWTSKTKLPVSPFQLSQNSHLILPQSNDSNGKNVPWSEDRAALCMSSCQPPRFFSLFSRFSLCSPHLLGKNITKKNLTMTRLYISESHF